MRYDPGHLIHGGCRLKKGVANLLFFEDLDQGMLAVVSPDARPPSQIARITLKPVPGLPPPVDHN